MDPIVNDLINALIVGLVPVAIGALGYLAKQVINLIQANVSREQYAMLEKIAAATVASIKSVPEHLRSKWQRDYWKKQPLATYGHYVVLVYENDGWVYACPTMQEGKPGRSATPAEVKVLRDSKGEAGFPTPPAMILVHRK